MIAWGRIVILLSLLLGAGSRAQAAPQFRPEAGLESEALSIAVRILQAERAGLRNRLEALLDRRMRLLLADPDGGGPELRSQLERARRGAALDFLVGVARRGKSASGRVAFPLDDVPARARAEALARETCLLLAMEAFGGRAAIDPERAPESFAAVPISILAESPDRAAAGAGAERVLILTAAVPAGTGVALVGGVRLSALEGKIQHEMNARHGPTAPRWTVFVTAAGSVDSAASSSGFPPRVAIGDEVGRALPRGLALSLASAGRVRWPQLGIGSGGSENGRGEWLALRDPSGALIGGMGAVTQVRSVSLGAPAGSPERARDDPPRASAIRWAAAAWLALVVGIALLVLAARSGGRRIQAAHREAHLALLNDFKAAALRQLDPTSLVPQVERSVERAVERAGTRMAADLGATLAEGISTRMKKFDQESAPRAAAPPPSPRAALSESILSALLAEQFPLAVIGVDANLEIFAWNPAAAKLWNAPARERAGKRLGTISFGGIEAEILDMARAAVEHGTASPATRLSFDRDRVYHVEVAAIPLGTAQASGGTPRRALVLASDVSVHIDSEISAKLLSGYQKALSASLPVPVVVTDKGGYVMSWNGAAAQELAIGEEDALGKELSGLAVPPVPHSAFPFKGPEGDARGTLHVYGPAAPHVQAVETPKAPAPSAVAQAAEAHTADPAGEEAPAPTEAPASAETAAATA